jgi:hypothetical protein
VVVDGRKDFETVFLLEVLEQNLMMPKSDQAHASAPKETSDNLDTE